MGGDDLRNIIISGGASIFVTSKNKIGLCLPGELKEMVDHCNHKPSPPIPAKGHKEKVSRSF